jgi:hypothetical protein
VASSALMVMSQSFSQQKAPPATMPCTAAMTGAEGLGHEQDG